MIDEIHPSLERVQLLAQHVDLRLQRCNTSGIAFKAGSSKFANEGLSLVDG
jgi:hypothetical protein